MLIMLKHLTVPLDGLCLLFVAVRIPMLSRFQDCNEYSISFGCFITLFVVILRLEQFLPSLLVFSKKVSLGKNYFNFVFSVKPLSCKDFSSIIRLNQCHGFAPVIITNRLCPIKKKCDFIIILISHKLIN